MFSVRSDMTWFQFVETVKGYASHEKTVFEKVTQARSMAMQATSPAEMAKAENML